MEFFSDQVGADGDVAAIDVIDEEGGGDQDEPGREGGQSAGIVVRARHCRILTPGQGYCKNKLLCWRDRLNCRWCTAIAASTSPRVEVGVASTTFSRTPVRGQ